MTNKSLSVNNIPPFVKGGWGDFPQGGPKQIPLCPPFSKGDFIAPAYLRTGSKFFLSSLVFLVVWLGISPLLTMAKQGDPPQNPQALDEKNRRYFSDLKVLTHEGQEVRFYTDLLKDKIVVINFFYTNCPTAQMSLVTLFKLQKMLGDQLGTDIRLLSISVDSERDTLKAVQEYADKYNPKKGWIFLTGKKENLDAINLRLGNRSLIPESHIQVFLLGNLRTGHWMRLPESAQAAAVAEGLRNLLPEK